MAKLTDEEKAARAEARAKEPAICAALDGEDQHRHSAEPVNAGPRGDD